jgi:hypothetical protein
MDERAPVKITPCMLKAIFQGNPTPFMIFGVTYTLLANYLFRCLAVSRPLIISMTLFVNKVNNINA